MITTLAVMAVIIMAGASWALAGMPGRFPAVVTTTVTRVVPGPVVTRIVIRTVRVPAPAVTVRVPGPVVYRYRNGYPYISQDPAWNCAGNWFNVYLKNQLAFPATPGGPEQVWLSLCPGVPMPAN